MKYFSNWMLLLAMFAALLCVDATLFAQEGAAVQDPPTEAQTKEERKKAKRERRKAKREQKEAAKAEAAKQAAEDAAKADKADDKAEEKQLYIRVKRDDRDQAVTMETATITWVAKGKKNKGVSVDLIGAVHIGDAKYYEDLNKLFDTYDVLLYELVAPEGTVIPKGGGGKRSGSLIGALQGGMKDLLDLEYQLEKVDYTKKNFVHADMSPEEFAKSMKDRGESFLQIVFKAMGQSAAMQAKQKRPVSDADLLMALFSKDRPLRLKRLMANQFEDMESSMDLFNGPEGSTILTERNKKALEVLEREIGKGHKKIGIFYGAAHLPDFEERLAKDFGMKRAGTKWFVAWDLSGK